MKKIIGMRILKTALAVTICVIISKLLKLEYPFYVAIAAIISMESSITSSYKAGRNRMAGTLVGALTGLLFASIQPGNAILCGLGTIVLIFICERFHWNNSISIAGIVFIAIMVNLNGKSPLLYGASRILDTFIGISVALLINYLVFPPNIGKMVQDQYADLLRILQSSADQISQPTPECDLETVHDQIESLEKLIQAHGKDTQLFRRKAVDLSQVEDKLRVCKNILHHLSVIQDNLSSPNMETQNDQVISYHQQRITQHLQFLLA
jgi:uncharacterized membrane protein YgaE (UPF0421/DUF939 family)